MRSQSQTATFPCYRRFRAVFQVRNTSQKNRFHGGGHGDLLTSSVRAVCEWCVCVSFSYVVRTSYCNLKITVSLEVL
jgi:hypothetical protein